jgi:hypothetical protein
MKMLKEMLQPVLIVLLVYIVLRYVLFDDMRFLRPTQSTVNQQMYYVLKNKPNAVAAANMLATAELRIQTLLQQLHSMIAQNKVPAEMQSNVKLLLRRYPHTRRNIFELNAGRSQTIAYNQNKAEKIFVCLRQQPDSPQLGDLNSVVYVLLHELAHTMVLHYDPDLRGQTLHSAEFKKCESFIHNLAAGLGIVSLQDAQGKEHCGVTIR